MEIANDPKRRHVELGLLDFRLRAKAQEHNIGLITVAIYIVNAPGILLIQPCSVGEEFASYDFPQVTLKARETLVCAAKKAVYAQLGLTVSHAINIALGFDFTDSIGRSGRCFLVCGCVEKYLRLENVRLNPSAHIAKTFIYTLEELQKSRVSHETGCIVRRILSNKEVVTRFIF